MSRSLLFVAVGLASAAVASFGADDWPAFRGPTGDGHTTAANVPLTWSETAHVRWKTPVHGKGWASPVIAGETIWLATADEVAADKSAPAVKGSPPANPVQKVTFAVVGLDRTSGKVTHDIALTTETNPAYCHPFNSYASCTPCVAAGRLYAHFGSHGTWCLDTATGKVVWERKDLKCDHYRGPASSPVVHDGKVFIIFDGVDVQYVAALDAATGATVWKTDRAIKYTNDNGDYHKAYATPAVLTAGGKAQLVCPSAECTIAYDPATGAELWRVTHGGMNGSARPVAANGLLYLTSGHNGRLLALKEGVTGKVAAEAAVWQASKGVPSRPSVTLAGDLLFLVADNGIASCLEAATGKVVWSERLDGEFSASPVLVGDHLIVPNQTGKTFVLAAGRTFDVVGENRLDAGCMASPAALGDTLYLRTKTHLYAIGK